jgi:hypothetical protein|tara:strand:- start:48 stop:284 length:237 start_codon:yes stop_codon:yes gene_type:complete
MALFSKTPSIDEQTTLGDITYSWNGTAWEIYSKPTPRQVYFESSSPPSSPQDGDVWKNTSIEKKFKYMGGEENVWIEG